jgi:hypothetical protein
MIFKDFRKKLKEDFAGTGVSGVAGIGVPVNGDKAQAEPGGKAAKMTLLKRKKRIK